MAAVMATPLAAQDLASANAAFMQQRFPDAQRAYSAVIASGAPADRAEAVLSLAVIDWKIDGDTVRAMRDLAPFHASAAALTMMSRARLDAGNVDGARAAAFAALRGTYDGPRASEERRDAAVALADAAAYPYEHSCFESNASRAHPSARSDSTLRVAIALLRADVTAESGHLESSDRLVRLAAIAGDWPALALGWRSYYLVGSRVPNGPLVRAEAELRAMESSTARDKPVHALAALVDSKLFEPAALIATCGALAARTPDASTAELIAYARFLRDTKRATSAYYRDVAHARGDTTAWRASLDAAGRALWPSLRWTGAVPAYSFDSLGAQLDRRFGLITNIGHTGDVLDLHAGHRVSNEDRVETQYGKSAHVRFSVIDGMISDGYQTWAWDNRAAHGGWASDVEIVQVRDGYAEGPLRAWHAITDPKIIARDASDFTRDSIVDVRRARDSTIAYFPSVESALRRGARLELRDSLRRSGLSGTALQRAFVREYGKAVDESSIFAHEGRHAIDKTLHVADSSAKNLEYQAKLSEMAFAPLPRLALAGIFNSNLGDETSHGIANAKVLVGLLDWMRHHGFSEGADELPLPLRIPTLTDSQLRAAARALDPMAAGLADASAKR